MPGPTNKTKAFDYAQDVTKQVLTLATAVVTITVSFLRDIAKAAPSDARTVLYIAWGLFALSILAGVATLLNLTGHVSRAEEDGSEGIYTSGVRTFSLAQLACFVLAISGTIYFGARAFNAESTVCPKTAPATSSAGTKTVPAPASSPTPAIRAATTSAC